MPLPLISATAAVGVAQVHGQRGAAVAGHDPQHAVGPDAPMAVTQGAHLGRRQGSAVVGVEQHEEVVARPVVLGQAQGPPVVGVASPSVSHPGSGAGTGDRRPTTSSSCAPGGRRSGRASGCGGRAGTRPTAGGRRPGSGATASATASSRGTPVLDVGQQLPVPERLAGGARQAPGRAARARTSSRSPPSSSARKRRSMRASWTAGSKRMPTRTERGGRVGVEPGTEGGEGPARPEGHLEGPDHPAAVGRLHARARPPGRARPAGRAERCQASRAVGLGLEGGGHARASGPGARGRRRRRAGRDRCPPRAGPGARARRSRPAPRRAAAWNRRTRELLVRVDQIEQVVRDLGRARPASAWPCRCPCPGRRPWSRPTRARPPVAGGPGPVPAPTCPTRWGRPGPRAAARVGDHRALAARRRECARRGAGRRGHPRPARRAGGAGRRR